MTDIEKALIDIDLRLTALHNEFYLLKKQKDDRIDLIETKLDNLIKFANEIKSSLNLKCEKCEGTGWEISPHTGNKYVCDCLNES